MLNASFTSQYYPTHGFVTFWVEPVQFTLAPLFYSCRLGFEYGNFSAFMTNAKVILPTRSFVLDFIDSSFAPLNNVSSLYILAIHHTSLLLREQL